MHPIFHCGVPLKKIIVGVSAKMVDLAPTISNTKMESSPSQSRRWLNLLFNPFVYVVGIHALTVGLGVILVTALLGSLSHTHFDGVLDLHSGASRPLAVFLLEGTIDWLALGGVLCLVGRLIAPAGFRAIDVLGTQALARLPTILMALLTFPRAFRRFGATLVHQLASPAPSLNLATPDAIYFIAATLLTLPCLVWMVLLMYRGFSVSCHVQGARTVWSFVGALLIAEVIAKVAITALLELSI